MSNITRLEPLPDGGPVLSLTNLQHTLNEAARRTRHLNPPVCYVFIAEPDYRNTSEPFYAISDTQPTAQPAYIAVGADGENTGIELNPARALEQYVPELAVLELQDHVYKMRAEAAELIQAARQKRQEADEAEALADFRVQKLVAVCALLDDCCSVDGRVQQERYVTKVGLDRDPGSIPNKALEEEQRTVFEYAQQRGLLK